MGDPKSLIEVLAVDDLPELMEHLGRKVWVLDHLEDLESDFSVFHRVDDMYELDAERFWTMTQRIGHYGGATAVAIRRAVDQEPPVRYVEDETGTPTPLSAADLAAYGGMEGMG